MAEYYLISQLPSLDGISDGMPLPIGEERFLEFYDRYGYIVYGKRKDELIDILDEKEPLTMYLKVGLKILNAPMGTSLSTITHNWNDM